MEALLGSPLAAGAIGLSLVALAAIAFAQTRSRAGLGFVVLALVAAAGVVGLERWAQTPRERAVAAIEKLFAAIAANDLPAVLAQIDPSAADVRADAELLMPRFRVEGASTGSEVRLEIPPDATTTTAKLKPLIRVRHTQSGAAGAYFDGLELDLALVGDRWLVRAYRAKQDWREGAQRLGR